MKPAKKKSVSASMAALVITILLGMTATANAGGDQLALPYIFSPGTAISSSQVNSNFQQLAQSMPGVKVVLGTNGVTLSTQWQNLASITVVPPADGIIMFIANAQVTISQGSTAGGSSWGFTSMALCTTPTAGSGGGPNCTGGGGILTFDTMPTGAVGNYAPRLTVPITNIGFVPVVKSTPITYYLTAAAEASSVGSAVINTSSLTALFLSGGYLQ